MIVDREDNLDVLTVMVEVDESVFSDEIRKLDALRNKIAATLKTALGVSVKVKLVEPKSIQRSEGKAVRVIDNEWELQFNNCRYFLKTEKEDWMKSFLY